MENRTTIGTVTMRKLFNIPIIHTSDDLGSHLVEAKKEYVSKYGLSKWDDHINAVDKFWRELREALLALPVDYKNANLYQDSLPVCDLELEIVKELAENGNVNYQILLELVKKGATIMGSEDPKLLIEERNRIIENGVTTLSNVYDDLMERRDSYIAQRINTTLKDDEIGLLFIGALHKVADKLPSDIQVVNLPTRQNSPKEKD
jgi:hypothetical protein